METHVRTRGHLHSVRRPCTQFKQHNKFDRFVTDPGATGDKLNEDSGPAAENALHQGLASKATPRTGQSQRPERLLTFAALPLGENSKRCWTTCLTAAPLMRAGE